VVSDYPLLLDLAGRKVVVVGGGEVATRRVVDLCRAGAEVTVVAPTVSGRIHHLVGTEEVQWEAREFAGRDVLGAWLVVAATDEPSVNERAVAAAERNQTFCVRADSAVGGNARTPAVLRRGPMTVAVNAGDDPLRAVALRDEIGTALDTGMLASRPRRPSGRGRVALVGGGPGDPDLITVRGRRLVAEADVVVVDRLAPRELVLALPDDVEIIDCGKAAHRHNLTQDQINAVLIDRARAGARVVRLKGGDPYIYGRGTEEVQACLEAGVDVEVVPGLSSATAGPALAGIPLTHRGVAVDFAVVSGHLDPGLPRDGGLDWPALATGPDTVVLLMAMERLGDIAATLIGHGRSARTPSAVVHRAGSRRQIVVRAPLDEIGAAAAARGVGAPAVVVVGAVAGLPDLPSWVPSPPNS
jgi:uroporphyrin-III C-methyltransferase/precorrin-2 dehydrogenase/sirohydrochlorin ferrochelatase